MGALCCCCRSENESSEERPLLEANPSFAVDDYVVEGKTRGGKRRNHANGDGNADNGNTNITLGSDDMRMGLYGERLKTVMAQSDEASAGFVKVSLAKEDVLLSTKFGLLEGDVVESMNGVLIEDLEAFEREYRQSYGRGEAVEINVSRAPPALSNPGSSVNGGTEGASANGGDGSGSKEKGPAYTQLPARKDPTQYVQVYFGSTGSTSFGYLSTGFGLQNRDIVDTVNGTSITSLEHFNEIYRLCHQANLEVEISVSRKCSEDSSNTHSMNQNADENPV